MVLGEIERNQTEKIIVEKNVYKGKNFISIRIYYLAENGEWRPTKKGVTIKPEKVAELVEILKNPDITTEITE